jgi:hypothetical protein
VGGWCRRFEAPRRDRLKQRRVGQPLCAAHTLTHEHTLRHGSCTPSRPNTRIHYSHPTPLAMLQFVSSLCLAGSSRLRHGLSSRIPALTGLLVRIPYISKPGWLCMRTVLDLAHPASTSRILPERVDRPALRHHCTSMRRIRPRLESPALLHSSSAPFAAKRPSSTTGMYSRSSPHTSIRCWRKSS